MYTLFSFFVLLFYHMTTGSESRWRRIGFETKPVLLSLFHFGSSSCSAGPKNLSEMHSSEHGQAACNSAHYAWSRNCCLGFPFCNVWAHVRQRRPHDPGHALELAQFAATSEFMLQTPAEVLRPCLSCPVWSQACSMPMDSQNHRIES